MLFTGNFRLLYLFLFCSVLNVSAGPDSTVFVSYTFDNHNFREENGRMTAKPVGVVLVEDRFGNDRSAAYMHGHLNSYLNLGTSPLLKPKRGTISMWVNLSFYIHSGKGVNENPLIMTKKSAGDDYYTAYFLCVTPDEHRFLAYSTRDSTEEASVIGINKMRMNQWYHVVMTYDNHSQALYIDGKLQGRCVKNYDTHFLASDSVIIGHTANKKNERYSMGAIDDIRIYHRVLNDREILELYHAPNPNRTTLILYEILYWLVVLAGIFAVAFLLVWRRRRKLKRIGDQLETNRKLYEMEVRTLKAQMNPHFIFNALSSVQALIVNSENSKAESYLSKFSKLLRELLESSTRESLSVPEEVSILHKYLEIESLRFGQSFRYSITVDKRIDNEQTRIPHMMVQPFVENAIWHGLLQKEGDRRLSIALEYHSEKTIRCIVDDNGIGRELSRKKRTTMKKKSLSMSMVRQRLELLNRLLNTNCTVEVYDKGPVSNGESGTRVMVILPLLFTN